MPGIISRRPARGRSPKRTSNKEATRPQPASPILITNAVPAGSVLTLTFNQPVLLNGTPEFTTNIPGPVPVSAAQTAPNVVAITFSASIMGGTETVNIGFRDPAIRNSSGGYVTGNVFLIP